MSPHFCCRSRHNVVSLSRTSRQNFLSRHFAEIISPKCPIFFKLPVLLRDGYNFYFCPLCHTQKQSEEGKLSVISYQFSPENMYAFQKSGGSYYPWGPVLRDTIYGSVSVNLAGEFDHYR